MRGHCSITLIFGLQPGFSARTLIGPTLEPGPFHSRILTGFGRARMKRPCSGAGLREPILPCQVRQFRENRVYPKSSSQYVCEGTESEPGVHEEILMGLVQAERAHNECACAIEESQLPETLARLGQPCRKLSMSGLRGWCLASPRRCPAPRSPVNWRWHSRRVAASGQ